MRLVKSAWNRPVDGKLWGMKGGARLVGFVSDPELLLPEVFEVKTGIERQIYAGPDFWRNLPLETRREVIKSLLRITVNKGRTFDRIEVVKLFEGLKE